MNIALVALMGLPSSGKSTLCSTILHHSYKFKESTKILQFTFDEFVPISVQRAYSALPIPTTEDTNCQPDDNKTTLAKLLRCRFIRTIECLIEKLKILGTSDSDSSVFEQEIVTEVDQLLDTEFSLKHIPSTCFDEMESFGTKLYRIVESVKFREYKNIIVMMDDNNYYHSMRNDMYQIAKKYKTGFCILYPITSVDECIARNSEREDDTRVPDHVIRLMSTKLEEPNPLKNPCDIYCVQVQNVRDERIHSEIQATLEACLTNPICIEVEDRTEEIERDRRVCAENEIHQADQILRKWIHTKTITSRLVPNQSSASKESIRQFTQNLLERKSAILDGLRSGTITVQSDGSDFLGFQKEILKLAEDGIS